VRWGEDWIRFVDGGYPDPHWQYARPMLLSLLPPPGHLTVDLGCGEGRLARALRRLGHTVLGVDVAPLLVERARELDPGGEYVEADAASLPLADDDADLVVAYMSLMEMGDLDAVVHEAGRVLAPGGRLCFVVLHPFETAASADGDTLSLGGSYFEVQEREERLGDVVFRSFHRPLAAYAQALERAGFAIEALREPRLADGPLRWRLLPLALVGRAVRS
jgi:ubiquinone/menaquinone biosynthesis C-methylase UbiE